MCYNVTMPVPIQATEWISQARRGTLELCVLTLISQKPHYGYQMVTELGKWEQLAAPEGTLYPMLRRLQKESYIEGKWQESDSGPPRKYYHLTDTGKSLLFTISSEWGELTRAIESLQRNEQESGELSESVK